MSVDPTKQPYYNNSDTPAPGLRDPEWSTTGVFVHPEYSDLSAAGPAPAPAPGFSPSSEDYRTSPYASGGDVNRQINADQVHEPFYSELGPKPFAG